MDNQLIKPATRNWMLFVKIKALTSKSPTYFESKPLLDGLKNTRER